MTTKENKWIKEQEFIYLTKLRELQARIHWNNQRIEIDKKLSPKD